MSAQHQQGTLVQADFFENSGGLNTTDSPFRVGDNQATGGYNYDYVNTGGIQKRYGATQLNTVADPQLRSLGFGMNSDTDNVKTLLRAAGTKLQSVNQLTGVCTDLESDDTIPVSQFFTDNTPVVMSQFTTTAQSTMWCAGGGLASGVLIGDADGVVTENGVPAPTGSLSLADHTSGGSLPDSSAFYYSIAFHKLSTGAISNAALDALVTTGNSGSDINSVTVDLTSLDPFDATKYDLIYIYRSAVSGVNGFTTGDLIAQVSSLSSNYLDTGAIQGSGSLVPRVHNVLSDNSVLPAGTYKTLTVFKRRLVTAQGSTVYISDLNKPESWPDQNSITLPSGGDITALGIISFSTPTTTSNDEFLVIFKERELWVITGDDAENYSLKFIDYVGCIAQPLLVWANGFLSWIDYRGVYLWDGSYKPIYCSRPIEYDFGVTGDIELSKLNLGWGTFLRRQNQIIWVLSSRTMGEQVLGLKLDVRLTFPQISDALAGRVMEGVFAKDNHATAFYSGFSSLPTSSETLYAGGSAGDIYKMYDNVNSDAGMAISFKYRTKTADLGMIATAKRYHKVIVWCRDTSTADLVLNYWVTYRIADNVKATQSEQMTAYPTTSYWDQGYWDGALWDFSLATYTPVVFNLANDDIGIDGDAITLEFEQSDLNTPAAIAGYSIIHSLQGLRK